MKKNEGFVILCSMSAILFLGGMLWYVHESPDSPMIPFSSSATILYASFAILMRKGPLQLKQPRHINGEYRPVCAIACVMIPLVAYAAYTSWQELIFRNILTGTPLHLTTQFIAPILFSISSALGLDLVSKEVKPMASSNSV